MDKDLDQLHLYYREGDNQFRIAGGEEGCRKLANDFYDVMASIPEAEHILKLHPRDLTVSREKLALFLCGYMNGPERYEEEYGPLQLAPAHGHIPIRSADRDAWLLCMKKALAMQDYPQEFQDFMLMRFSVPAERIRNRP
jgi:hemoglobin